MTASERDQPRAGSRRVLILYVVGPLVIAAAAVVLIVGSPNSALDALAVLVAIASAIWWLVRVRRFFTYRKRLAASSDSFPATVVARRSRSVVNRFLWRRYLTLDAPYNDDLPNIRVALLLAQTVPALEGDQTIRVRGPESGVGPLVLVNPADGSVLLGSGSRFDASQPGGLRLVWLALLKTGRATGRQVRRGFRAIPNAPRALARAVSAVARGLARALTVAITFLARSIAGAPHAIVVAATIIGRTAAAAVRATIRRLRAGARGATRALVATVAFLATAFSRAPRAIVVALAVIGRTLAATILRVVRLVALAARATIRGLKAAARGVAHLATAATLATIRAAWAGARGATRAVFATVAFLAKAMTHAPRAIIVALAVMGRTVAVTATGIAHFIAAAGRAAIRAIRATARGVVTAVVATIAFLAHAIANTPRALAAAGRALGRAVRAAGRLAAGLAIAAIRLLMRSPQLVRTLLAGLGRFLRVLSHVPSHLVHAAGVAWAASRRFAIWLRQPRVFLRYVGLPLALVVIGAAGMALTDGLNQTLTGLPLGAFLAALALALIGGLWFSIRFERHRRYRQNVLTAGDSLAARVLWIRPAYGMRRVLERGRLALELPGGGQEPCLLVSLLPGQPLPLLSAGEEVAISMRSGRPHGLAVLQREGAPGLIGYCHLFGPYLLTEPDVLRCARTVVRRDTVVYASLWWPLIKRHRDFRRLLTRGSSSVASEVVGTTQPKWYERIEGRDTVWLQLDGSSSPRYVSMRLLGRQDGTTLSPGEAVTLYGRGDGSGSVIAVGSQRRTTLLGVGQAWSAPEPTEE